MKTKSFQDAERQQTSVLASLERAALRGLARRMPGWVNSDHLSILGFLGMIVAGVFYALSKWNPLLLHLVNLCIFINWFGDSLDGTLARYRDRQRPRYGFYVDHIVDAFGIAFVLIGLGLSGYISPILALGFLSAYFLMNIEIYLTTYTLGEFKLSYGILGPSELRVFVAMGNLFLLSRKTVHLWGHTFLLCDISAVVAIAIFLAIAIVSSIQHTHRLYNEERLQ